VFYAAADDHVRCVVVDMLEHVADRWVTRTECRPPVASTVPAGARRWLPPRPLIALIVNAGMFLVEGVSGLLGDSVSLQPMRWISSRCRELWPRPRRARTRPHPSSHGGPDQRRVHGLFGLWVVGAAVHNMVRDRPSPASWCRRLPCLAANLGVAVLLYRHRQATATALVWLCTRNDAIGNLAVMLAASGVLPAAPPGPICSRRRHGRTRPVVLLRVIMQAVGEIRGAASLTPANSE